jgi:hypothetical protein
MIIVQRHIWRRTNFRGLLLTRKLLNQGFLLVKLKSSLRKFYGRHHELVDRYGISASQMTTDMFHLSLGFVTRLTRRLSLVEQELPTLPEHLSSPPVFSRVRVTQSLIVYACCVDQCLSFCTFSVGLYVVCSSSIYEFWLPFGILRLFLSKSYPRGFHVILSFCRRVCDIDFIFFLSVMVSTVLADLQNILIGTANRRNHQE